MYAETVIRKKENNNNVSLSPCLLAAEKNEILHYKCELPFRKKPCQNKACGTMKWYAVQTYSCRERIVAQSFESQGIYHYLPLITEKHYWSDRVKIIQIPLFKSYLFIKIFPTYNNFIKILSTRGVTRILGDEKGFISVANKDIEAIANLLATGTKLKVMSGFQNGQPVKIKTGPLQDIEGTVFRMKGKTLLAINICLLGQTVLAELNCRNVEPC